MVFIVQSGVVALPVNAKLLPVITTLKESAEVSPKSLVVVSVKLTVVPDHKDIISPARASLPDFATYLKNAPSYDEVGNEYTVNDPTAETVFLTVVVNVGAALSPYKILLSEYTSNM